MRGTISGIHGTDYSCRNLNTFSYSRNEQIFYDTSSPLSYMELDDAHWHSIECKLTPATRSPEICFCTL